MKKTIIAAVLGASGLLAAVSSSQAQGFIYFCNYSSIGEVSPVTISGSGQYIGAGWSANLLYSYGANLGVTYTSLDLGQTVSFLGTTGGSPDTDGAGLFGGLTVQVAIPGYTSGAIDFIVQAYNGASYATSTFVGQSGVIQLSGLATAANGLPTGSMFASDNTAVISGIQGFTVSAVPEPSTLALAGLGGFGMLMALRRKKA